MDQNEIRQTLENEKQRLEALRDDLNASEEITTDENAQSGGDTASVDNHPADAATETMQREINLSTIEQLEAELDDVENAMTKLEAGTYGVSELSGDKIDEERLAAMPTARYTMEEQMRIEQENKGGNTSDAGGLGSTAL